MATGVEHMIKMKKGEILACYEITEYVEEQEWDSDTNLTLNIRNNFKAPKKEWI